jgi:hypothetical protein
MSPPQRLRRILHTRFAPSEHDAEKLLQALNQGVAVEIGLISREQFDLIGSSSKQLELKPVLE